MRVKLITTRRMGFFEVSVTNVFLKVKRFFVSRCRSSFDGRQVNTEVWQVEACLLTDKDPDTRVRKYNVADEPACFWFTYNKKRGYCWQS